jgi:hypothetical protein
MHTQITVFSQPFRVRWFSSTDTQIPIYLHSTGIRSDGGWVANQFVEKKARKWSGVRGLGFNQHA